MLFPKIKTILSAKHLLAQHERGLLLTSWNSRLVYAMADGQWFPPQLPAASRPPTPDSDKPPCLLGHTPVKERREGLNFFRFRPGFLPEDRTFRWSNLELRISRSPLWLLSGSEWRILSAEQCHGNQFFKPFFKNTSRISSGNIPITQLD